MSQQARGPTHRAGHTLDLVLTFSALRLQSVSVDPAGAISDHALMTCRLPVVDHSSTVIERIVCGWRAVDRDEIGRLLENSDLCRPVSVDCDVNQLFEAQSLFCGMLLISLPHRILLGEVLSVWLRGLILNADVAAKLSTS